jgi:putative membrane protein
MGIEERIRHALERVWVDRMHLPTLEQSMVLLTDWHGICERINLTPIPFSYTTLIHRITAVYCYALPFGLVDAVGIYTPIVCTIVAYAFFGLDVVGDEIEMPFGRDANDLPLRAISRTIEVNLRQRLGETELPGMLRPVDEVLD